MERPGMEGYWEIRGEITNDDVVLIKRALDEGQAQGKPILVRAGIELVWHELDRVTEDAVRAEAIAVERVRFIHALDAYAVWRKMYGEFERYEFDVGPATAANLVQLRHGNDEYVQRMVFIERMDAVMAGGTVLDAER